MKTLSPPTALIFDMDGLLIDSEPLWADVEREYAEGRGAVWTDEDARGNLGQGIAATLMRMSTMFGFTVDIERDKRWILDRFLERRAELRLKPGARELLDVWHPRPVALASSSPRPLIVAALTATDVLQRFPIVVSGEEVARPKPAPDIFLEAARQLQVSPEACLVLEDSVAGVTAACAAGMPVVAVPEDTSRQTELEALTPYLAFSLLAVHEQLR